MTNKDNFTGTMAKGALPSMTARPRLRMGRGTSDSHRTSRTTSSPSFWAPSSKHGAGPKCLWIPPRLFHHRPLLLSPSLHNRSISIFQRLR